MSMSSTVRSIFLVGNCQADSINFPNSIESSFPLHGQLLFFSSLHSMSAKEIEIVFDLLWYLDSDRSNLQKALVSGVSRHTSIVLGLPSPLYLKLNPFNNRIVLNISFEIILLICTHPPSPRSKSILIPSPSSAIDFAPDEFVEFSP